MTAAAIVWFRNDLRLADNPALQVALDSGRPVLPVYIHDDVTPGRWRLGAASRWWLHRSLQALDADLQRRGSRLLLRSGEADRVLLDLVAEVGAGAVFWNRRYEAWAVAQDSLIKAALKARNVTVGSRNGTLVHEPWDVVGTGGPALVFSPFHRAWLDRGMPLLSGTGPPDRWPGVDPPAGQRLEDWALLPPAPDWTGGLRQSWRPGEAAAMAMARAFMAEGLASYRTRRHQPGVDGVSRLSPHLRFGEIAPLRLAAMAGLGSAYARQLAWRDFAWQLLYFRPDLPELELQPRMRGFPWRDDPVGLAAWQRGRTGYPLVDAGMRQLRFSGWMHNRARMVVASFLTRHLLVDWRHGHEWFRDELVDADPASNAMNWQWVAGSGTDTMGFGRIFNPIRQGLDLDPDGTYVRRWVAELAASSAEAIHRTPPADLLACAGSGYPPPLVDLQEGRVRALAAHAAHLEGQA